MSEKFVTTITTEVQLNLEELASKLVHNEKFVEIFLREADADNFAGVHLTVSLLLNLNVHKPVVGMIVDTFWAELDDATKAEDIADENVWAWINKRLPQQNPLPEAQNYENWSADPVVSGLQLLRDWIRRRSLSHTDRQWVKVYEWIREGVVDGIFDLIEEQKYLAAHAEGG